MCKTRVQTVYYLLKKPSAVHKLCAAWGHFSTRGVSNWYFSIVLTRRSTPTFSTSFFAHFNLLFAQLYPQSTVPIIRTVK
jgi:hypothetical protein